MTKCNISPSFAIESLHKLIQSFCDYCGRRSMTEQSIRDNFILLYELVDEYYDNGYIQIPSVNDLLNLNVIYNQPTLDNLSEIWNLLLTADLIASHTDSSRHRSHNTAISSFAPPPHPTSTIIESPDKNQIFVDIVEYINVTSQSFYYRRNHINDTTHAQNNGYLQFNQTPIVQTSSIHGNVTMKVFLSSITYKKDKKKKKKKKKKRKKLSFGKKKNKNKGDDVKSEDEVVSSDGGVDLDAIDAMGAINDNAMEYLCGLKPGIRLQFNDDLIIGRQNAPPYNKIFGALILDDVSFHKKIMSSQRDIEDIIHEKEKILCLKNGSLSKHRSSQYNGTFIDNFAKKKILKFFLPNGEEFDIMNYRITSSFRDGSRSRNGSRRGSPRERSGDRHNAFSYKVKPNYMMNSGGAHADDTNYTDYIRIPFRIIPYFNVIQDQRIPTIEFYLKIRADFPRQCIGRDIIIEYNVPNCVSTVTLQTKVGNRTQAKIEMIADSMNHDGNNPSASGNSSSKASSSGSNLSDKELAAIKQTAECITIAKRTESAFGIDLTSKYSKHWNDIVNPDTIGIGQKRRLNPQRCTRKVVWKMNKFPSGVEQVLRCKFTLNYHHPMTERLLNGNHNRHHHNIIESEFKEDEEDSKSKEKHKELFDLFQFRKIVSPIAMKFQIDNYNVSGLDIRSLRCIDWTSQRDDGGSNNGLYTTYRPYRWVRRITKSGSYICRL
eukprot:18087_1